MLDRSCWVVMHGGIRVGSIGGADCTHTDIQSDSAPSSFLVTVHVTPLHAQELLGLLPFLAESQSPVYQVNQITTIFLLHIHRFRLYYLPTTDRFSISRNHCLHTTGRLELNQVNLTNLITWVTDSLP